MKPTRALRINPGGPQSTRHRMNVKGFASRAGGSCSKEASRHFLLLPPARPLTFIRWREGWPLTGLMQKARHLVRKLLQQSNRVAELEIITYHQTVSIRFSCEATIIVSIRFFCEATGGVSVACFDCSVNPLDKRAVQTESYSVCSPLCRLFAGSCFGIES
jgi:hypothetical protein